MGEQIVTQSQSSQTSGNPMGSISVMVVDDDTACLSIVGAILKTWNYQVVTIKHPFEALCTLRLNGGSFDLVILDVHMPDMNGFELQQKIDEEFNLPVVFMSADDEDSVVLKGLQNGAAFFLLKPIKPNDLKNLWQYAVGKNKRKAAIAREIRTTQATFQASKEPNDELNHSPLQQIFGNEKGINEELETESSVGNEAPKSAKDYKRKYPEIDEKEKDEDDSVAPKKKVVWTNALHNQFLEAIRCIGFDRAIPKKIREVMNVPGLTRANIASHLQKYRIFLRRVSEAGEKIQTASERNMVERTFRSNFAMAQPDLLQKKPHFQYNQNLDKNPMGKSVQINPSCVSQEPASFTNFPPQSGFGQSRLLRNQSNWKPSMTFGSTKFPNYHANSSGFSMEPNEYPTSLLPNGNENIPGGVMNGTTHMQMYQQKNQVAAERSANDHITRHGNIGVFNSSEVNPEPNYQKDNGYVGYRLASDGRPVGLSTHLIPNRGSANRVQTGITSNVPILSRNSGDYYGQGVSSSIGFQSGGYISPTVNDAIQNANISVTQPSPAVLASPVGFAGSTAPSLSVHQPAYPSSQTNNFGTAPSLSAHQPAYHSSQTNNFGTVPSLSGHQPAYPSSPTNSFATAPSLSQHQPAYSSSLTNNFGTAPSLSAHQPAYPSLQTNNFGTTPYYSTQKPVYPSSPTNNFGTAPYLSANQPAYSSLQTDNFGTAPSLTADQPAYPSSETNNFGTTPSLSAHQPVYPSLQTNNFGTTPYHSAHQPAYPSSPLNNFGTAPSLSASQQAYSSLQTDNFGTAPSLTAHQPAHPSLESDHIFGLLDGNAFNNVGMVDNNVGSFNTPNEISMIQSPIEQQLQQDNVEVPNPVALLFSPNHMENNTTVNNESLQQLPNHEMIFSNFGFDETDEEYPSGFDQMFNQYTQEEDEEFMKSIFGISDGSRV